MLNKIKDYLLSLIKTRVIYLMLVFIGLFSILLIRIFNLQIINGEDYLNNFQMQIKKQRTLDAPRGNIYDRNGVLLAYNQLAYSVTIEDVYESGKGKNEALNKTIYKVISILNGENDKISTDFAIYLDDKNTYQFSLSGTRLNRFKADIYGCPYIDDMTYAQSSSTAEDCMEYLAGEKRYNVNKDYSKQMRLDIVSIRYAMSANSYQKYIATTIANDVSNRSVAIILENSDILEGVNVKEDTIRVYPNGLYTSQIIGYTGKISADELNEYSENDASYSANDIVGKIGIEKSMEAQLRGEKGLETVFVDTLGRVISVEDHKDAIAGSDLYLTIDSELQEVCYNILEQKLAGIILKKLINAKEYIPEENATSADIMIPVYDVYYQLFNNSVIDINHLSAEDATESEQTALECFELKKQEVYDKLYSELTESGTVYKKMTTEYQVYENYIEDTLINLGILDASLIETTDKTYKAWAIDESISLAEYIKFTISQNWIKTDNLELSDAYTDSTEIYNAIIDILFKELSEDDAFDRIIYKYAVKQDYIKPKVICNILIDQGLVNLSEEETTKWYANKITPYSFIYNHIDNLDITPADLALDPYSASLVLTDVNSGEVLALVSYPSYDNNYLANGADAAYLKKLNTDQSKPMINYCTQQRTAPGSTYKMVVATAGLLEGVVKPTTQLMCSGSFEEINDVHKCWIYPGAHGSLNMSNAIKVSCNSYFYWVGYKLSLDEKGKYNSSLGVDKLAQYAAMYGFDEKSGVEIEEYAPQISNAYSVPSAIGQGTNNYTTVSLARYVTAVANSGTVYDLTLLDKLTDAYGNILVDYKAEVKNTIEMDSKYWDTIHDGMRKMVESKSYFNNFPIEVAGKTGTAQQSKTKPDHGLFVCYAPYDNPEIAIAMRIANGYTSEYVAEASVDILKYYYGIEEEDMIVTGTAADINVTHISGD